MLACLAGHCALFRGGIRISFSTIDRVQKGPLGYYTARRTNTKIGVESDLSVLMTTIRDELRMINFDQFNPKKIALK